jgi:hypothetical protein
MNPDEVVVHNRRNLIAFAMSGPDSNSRPPTTAAPAKMSATSKQTIRDPIFFRSLSVGRFMNSPQRL